AEQSEGVNADTAARAPFFAGFFAAADRIGWWLDNKDNSGEDRDDVVRRILAFAASLADDHAAPRLAIGITHSPILRALAISQLGYDLGELEWLGGLELSITRDRAVSVRPASVTVDQ